MFVSPFPNVNDGRLTPDGQRFLMVKLTDGGETIQVVLNWTEELKRLLPTAD